MKMLLSKQQAFPSEEPVSSNLKKENNWIANIIAKIRTVAIFIKSSPAREEKWDNLLVSNGIKIKKIPNTLEFLC